ncbi:uncharacterized protein V6R79_005237 [Siganus canaliculatus]
MEECVCVCVCVTEADPVQYAHLWAPATHSLMSRVPASHCDFFLPLLVLDSARPRVGEVFLSDKNDTRIRSATVRQEKHRIYVERCGNIVRDEGNQRQKSEEEENVYETFVFFLENILSVNICIL